MRSQYRTALNQAAAGADPLVVAVNVELPDDGTLPEWLELVPAGRVTGRDGRGWINDRPDQVVADSLGDGRDLPIDWEHATELRAPEGDPAPAAGWIVALANREGAVYGRVDWTPRGAESVRNREYRYISPVFLFERESSRVVRLTSAGLTNTPNLYIAALNRGEPRHPEHHHQEGAMLPEAIRKALGLSENATEDQAVTAINQLTEERQTALNRAENPSLERFVPRADYDAALERASNAEHKLAEQESKRLEAEIDAEIDAALAAGKITPATVDYHKAQCRQEGGLDRFKEYVKAAPTLGDPAELDDRKPEGDAGKALNAEQQKIAAMFGNTAEDLQKYGQA
ncbi:phage protease [Arhodomonas sp. AD133]|uniref:phage protease n=1 Tax=Arhodomonas sp. AD133 TaxID=3415009 RepID=UPI003EC0534E